MQPDLIITHVNIATMDTDVGNPYGAIKDGLIAIKNGKVMWCGAALDYPELIDEHAERTNRRFIDGNGGWLLPGLVDCHTHLIYGGNRAQEWESRLEGLSYEEISRRGGGIVSTVSATRQASFDSLYCAAEIRLKTLMREGVTCLEIKSGYGLNTETERKMLQVAKLLSESHPITIAKSFLGAHAVPTEFAGRSDEYIDLVVDEMMPLLAEEQLIDAVDVFCENIGFSRAQCERVFQRAAELGLPVKGHVEQLSDQSGARLVAEYGGLSVDHVEYLSPVDIPLIKETNVVPVLLPGAFYFLGETQKPPINEFRQAQIPMAIASDLNPGSSPICSLLLNMNLACVQFGLTPEESLAGVTRHGAMALGLGESKGLLKEGFDADLTLWQIDHPAELSYAVNMTSPEKVWVAGEEVHH
jgi:imidazolonepropionase